ncbi:MAG: LysE family translocator [Desulfobulbaceae bacterium]|nr:LysE family translocator [Desulfobulbaceae bacterium]
MDPQTFATCLIAVTLLTLTPGVDTMLIIRNSARGGWLDGAVSSLGICSGLFIHATVSALGISIILLQTAWAFNALKFAGAAYLIWLGLSSWKRAIRGRQNIFAGKVSTEQDIFLVSRSLREGFLSNVLNPKTVIFYMAFLPQFINPAEPALFQSLIVAGIHFSVAMLYQCLLAAMVNKARTWLQRPTVNRVFDTFTGSILLFIGLRLATDK